MPEMVAQELPPVDKPKALSETIVCGVPVKMLVLVLLTVQVGSRSVYAGIFRRARMMGCVQLRPPNLPTNHPPPATRHPPPATRHTLISTSATPECWRGASDALHALDPG